MENDIKEDINHIITLISHCYNDSSINTSNTNINDLNTTIDNINDFIPW